MVQCIWFRLVWKIIMIGSSTSANLSCWRSVVGNRWFQAGRLFRGDT